MAGKQAKARKRIKKNRKTYTKFISVFREETELKAFEVNKAIAKAYANEAKDIIKKQSYKWRPLSKKYKEDKIRRGYDSRIYIRTGEFLAAVSWGVTHGRVWTGIPSRKKHEGKFARSDEPERDPIPLWLLARWLEYGTSYREVMPDGKTVKTVMIPPRPIWRPLLAKFVKEEKSKFGKRYRKAFNKAVKRRTKQ
jgi:hypothetical protein